MTQIDKLRVYFVLPLEDTSKDDVSPNMALTSQMVTNYGGYTEWMKPSECLLHTPQNKDVFVFDKFEGEAFEFLKRNASKIVGTRCLLTCITNGRPIPPNPHPVFTEGMRDLWVTSTGFDQETKKQIQEKVQYMSGNYDNSLRSIITHLVAHNNLTSKALHAFKSNIKIMKLSWVEDVWQQSLTNNVNGSSAIFDKHAAPLFYNIYMTTSGIPKREKDKLKEQIEAHGGRFMGPLEERVTNVVLLTKPEGEKFRFANSWKIPCLNPLWVRDCINAKAILPFKEYIVDSSKPKSSTPNKENCTANFTANFTANLSMINNIESEKHVTHLDETAATLSGRSQFQTPKTINGVGNQLKAYNKLDKVEKSVHTNVINNILLKNLLNGGQFLDGLSIFIYGFNAEDGEKLKKILNMGGATRLNELSESVTHVIAGKNDEGSLTNLAKYGAYVLSIDWLVESMKLKRPANESQFLLVNRTANPSEPPSPMSKQGAQLLSQSEGRNLSRPQFSLEDKDNEKLSQIDELFCKYNASQPGEPLDQPDMGQTNPSSTTTSTTATTTTTTTTSTATSITRSSTTSVEDFFRGLTFYLSTNLTEEEFKYLEELITERDGQIVGKRDLGVPDFAVVPVLGASLTEVTAKEVVNIYYVKDCCVEECLLTPRYYHQPIAFVKNGDPLKDCVISVSNYVHGEREFMEMMIEALGGVAQSLLARKPKQGALKSTHLICAEPQGQKYGGAIRWGLPVVHHDWLLKCASTGMRVSEKPYLVGESKLPAQTSNNTLSSGSKVRNITELDASSSKTANIDIMPPPSSGSKVRNEMELNASCSRTADLDNMPPPSNMLSSGSRIRNITELDITSNRTNNSDSMPSSSQIRFPTNSEMSAAPSFRSTPVHSAIARVKATETPKSNSPDPNRTVTPTSPYGAFYGKGSPTPRTRKRIWKWMNQGAEFPLDPPPKPLESEGDSTPLSQLISRHLEMLKRKPEELPPDSPTEVQFKKLNLDAKETASEEADSESGAASVASVATSLSKMRKIEEGVTKNAIKSPSVPKTSDSDPGRQMVIVTESQAHTEVGWEDPVEKEVALGNLEKAARMEAKPKMFMFSCLSDRLTEAKETVENCGGVASQLPYFDAKATHLIAGNLTRGEKLLGSIAAGLWVLHPSYIDALKKAKCVDAVPEEDYEWGSPKQKFRLNLMSSMAKEFAHCSQAWRVSISNGEPPPFKDAKILLHLSETKYDSFKRMIEVGGGKVVKGQPPYNHEVKANLCVYDSNNTEPINFGSLARQKIKCVTPIYISDALLRKKDAVENNMVTEFLSYWNSK